MRAVKVRFKLSQLGSILAEFRDSLRARVVRPLQPDSILKLGGHNNLKVSGVNGSFNSLFDVRLAGVALLSKRAQGGTGKLIEGVKRGVQGPRDLVRRCCFLGLVLALSACAGLPETFEITPFLREQITGDTWRACLAREYQSQARSEVRPGRHWAEATRLATKGRAALDGQVVAPEIAPEGLSLARARLEHALANRDPDSCDCAKMQARFDGWVVKQARGADTAAVRASFEEAAGACAPSR